MNVLPAFPIDSGSTDPTAYVRPASNVAPACADWTPSDRVLSIRRVLDGDPSDAVGGCWAWRGTVRFRCDKVSPTWPCCRPDWPAVCSFRIAFRDRPIVVWAGRVVSGFRCEYGRRKYEFDSGNGLAEAEYVSLFRKKRLTKTITSWTF